MLSQKITAFTLVLGGLYSLNINAQSLVYTDTFDNSELWICNYSYDADEDMMDTAFCGIRDGKLIVYAQQGGGCAEAEALCTLTGVLNKKPEKYELVYYFNKIETYAALSGNYLYSNIMGSEVFIALGDVFVSEPFKISIIKNDSIRVKLNDAYIEQHPWNIDYLLTGFIAQDTTEHNRIDFDFSARGCSADFCHGALIEADSIQLFDTETPKQEVTFRIDMNDEEAIVFNEGDSVFISGSFVNWVEPGTNSSLKMSDSNGDKVFEITLAIEEGEIAYKYFKNSGWSMGEWSSEKSRSVTVSSDTLFSDVWGRIVSVKDNKWNSKLTLFPNPAYSRINISFTNVIDRIEVFSMEGIKVKELKNLNTHMDVSDLRDGIYIIQITSGSQVIQKRFLKSGQL